MKKGYLDTLGSKKLIKDQSLLRHEDIRHKLTILPELQALIPALLPDELAQLEANIRRDGCREALLVWETTEGVLTQGGSTTPVYVLVDGHNRYAICQKNKIDFRVNLRPFSGMEEVREFMIENQLGRRNLTPEQTSYLRGLRYREEKKERGQYNRQEQMGQNVPFAGEANPDAARTESASGSTAQRLARQYNVNDKTIKRDAEFSAGIDKLAPRLKADVLAGRSNVKKSLIQQLGKSDHADGSIESLDVFMELSSPTPSDSVAARTTTYREEIDEERANPAGLREQIKQLSAQLVKSSEVNGQLCDELIKCVNQLKASAS